MVETKIVFGALEAFLDGPAQAGDAGKLGQRRSGRRENEIIGSFGRLRAFAANENPMLESRLRRPRSPDTRPIVEARPLGAFAGGMAGPVSRIEFISQRRGRGRLERAAASAQVMGAPDRQHIGLLTRLQHAAKSTVGAIDRVAENPGARNPRIAASIMVFAIAGLVAKGTVSGIDALAHRVRSFVQLSGR